MKDSRQTYPVYLDWLRYICAFWLYFYGFAKIVGHQLTLPTSMLQNPVSSLSGYDLTWYYYGYSHPYKFILGSIQIVGASMLLFRKSTLLAAAALAPMMANIVLINIFYSISRGAATMSVFILCAMILILANAARPLLVTFWASQPSEPPESMRRHRIVRWCILAAVVVQVTFGATMLYLQHRRHG